MARRIDDEELIEYWTLIGDELALLVGRTGPSKLALALLLKFYTQRGRFPEGRSELQDDAVAYVAVQVKVPAADLGLFEWSGRTMERHRKTVRTFLGFRECSVPDAEKLTEWLADHVCCKERRVERVREALLAHLRAEKIEPPARVRLGRMIGAALRLSEETLTARISSRIPRTVTARMGALIAEASDDDAIGEDQPQPDTPTGAGADDGDAGPEVWAGIKKDPGNVSLRTTQEEVAKLASIRARQGSGDQMVS